MDSLLLLFLLCFSAPAVGASCHWCLASSKASFSSSSSDILRDGTCGYGSMVTHIIHKDAAFAVSAGSPALFRGGDGCGSCYQVRCRETGVCSRDGVRVIIMSEETSMDNHTAEAGFMLSKEAFMALALAPPLATSLLALKSVDVDFRRIPCEFSWNLSIRVEEESRRPSFLTIKILFQGGQTNILAVDVAEAGSTTWQYMNQRRTRPMIWSTSKAPAGPLQFRLVVTAGSGGKWVWTEKAVLPAEWIAGEVYDTGVQIRDVALDTCLQSLDSPADIDEHYRKQ